MRHVRRALCATLVGVLLLWVSVSLGEASRQEGTRFTLRSAVVHALQHNPLIGAERADVEVARLEKRDVWLRSWLPDVRADLQTGLVPEARGDLFFSPDDADDLDGLGPFYRLNLDLVQPIYGFGKRSAASNLARHAVGAREGQRDRVEDRITFEVVRAYWGLQFAKRGVELGDEVRDSYRELLDGIEEQLRDPESEVDDLDLLEARSRRFAIDEAYREAADRRKLAAATLVGLLGLPDDARARTAAVETPLVALSEDDLDRVRWLAESRNPGIGALERAVDAAGARIDLAAAERLPNLFFVGSFRYAHAGNRTDQTNPFVVDNFNYRRLGMFLGMRWDLNLFRRDNEVQRRRLEREATAGRLQALRRKVDIEAAEALSRILTREELLESAEESLRAATTWLAVSKENMDLGIGDVDRLLRAYQTHYRLRAEVIEAEFELNVAIARLARVLGDFRLYLEWIDDGRVTLPRTSRD